MFRNSTVLRDGVILNNRYRIVKQIGRGSFGRAYLAEDVHRYRELCFLKEFAPQIESDRELSKAKELFVREAGMLYKLSHKQIPKFEPLLHTLIDGRRSLFLVQEYIDGENYWQLLRRKVRLGETEVVAMLCDLLPVLEYIHDSKLVHRNISPNNLICRERDQKTVLLDFGSVKIAANAIARSTGQPVTPIGKKGYSPNEQVNCGQLLPSSDLYSLAATAVVLLTGKQPHELYDSHQKKWRWEPEVKASASLRKILNKMLADKPGDRYQSANQVLQILIKENSLPNLPSFVPRIHFSAIAPGKQGSSDYSYAGHTTSRAKSPTTCTSMIRQGQMTPVSQTPVKMYLQFIQPWHWGMILAGALLIPGLLSFAVIKTRIAPMMALSSRMNSRINPQANTQLPAPSKNERGLQEKIDQRLKSSDIDAGAFYNQVDRVFHDRHPELVGLALTDKPEHQSYRQSWYEIASRLLNKQEKNRLRSPSAHDPLKKFLKTNNVQTDSQIDLDVEQ